MPTTALQPDAGAAASRLRWALRGAGPQCELAARALLWRLSVHPGQVVGRLWYTELSVSYIRRVSGVAYATARAAWKRVREAVGWCSVHPRYAKRVGAELRDRAGGTWGQHLLLQPGTREAAAEVLEEIGGWDGASSDPTEWLTVEPVRRGGSLVTCCPWHNDREPSMALYPNRDGHSGAAVCFACTREGGAPLTGYWRLHEGRYRIRLARGISRSNVHDRTVDTIHNIGAAPAPRPGPSRVSSLVLGTLGSRGMAVRSSRCPDLLTLLERAGRVAAGPAAWPDLMARARTWDLSWEDDHRRHLPELYAGLDRMEPTAWRVVAGASGEVRIPSRWRPVEARHLAADLDGFDDGPVGDADLAQAGRRLAAWARRHPLLSGGVAVTRTSHLGVQVIVELAEPRREPRWWRKTDEAVQLADEFESEALRLVRDVGFEGGHADPTSRGAGRMIRRPGPRVDKLGTPCIARLAWLERAPS